MLLPRDSAADSHDRNGVFVAANRRRGQDLLRAVGWEVGSVPIARRQGGAGGVVLDDVLDVRAAGWAWDREWPAGQDKRVAAGARERLAVLDDAGADPGPDRDVGEEGKRPARAVSALRQGRRPHVRLDHRRGDLAEAFGRSASPASRSCESSARGPPDRSARRRQRRCQQSRSRADGPRPPAGLPDSAPSPAPRRRHGQVRSARPRGRRSRRCRGRRLRRRSWCRRRRCRWPSPARPSPLRRVLAWPQVAGRHAEDQLRRSIGHVVVLVLAPLPAGRSHLAGTARTSCGPSTSRRRTLTVPSRT